MTSPYRIGLGFDRHRMVEGRRCVLGGVEIPFPRGPLGHSDGDALLHAAIDAVLGAAGLDDLGTLFSDRDPRWKDADSRALAREAVSRVRAAGLSVVSMDAVVLAEAPRIGPHRAAIRASLAELFGLESDRVNVKGKSGEGVGEVGRGEILEATVVVLLAAS
jgi:2-C-methyl-D-erythritol 2,4-cyclodiphosphate synthase